MSHAPCCCSVWLGRCGRRDLLVDLEGFRLVSAARRECALVLDRESCDHCAGCPVCGVTCSRVRACGGGGDRRAQGRCCGNVPVAKYGAGCAENAPARSRPLSSRTTRCARPGRVWVCGRSVGRSDSCASREPPLPDWLDNWQPRGTPCGPLSSRACTAASEPRPPLQACGYPESMRGVWHHQARRRQGPRAHRHRGHSREGPSHGRLEWTWSREGLAPCTRTGAERGKDLRAGCANRDARSPSRDSKNTIALACSKDATSMRGTCHIVTLAGEATGEGRRRAGQDTTGSRF